MRLQLKVTADDIRLGVQEDCHKCAIARSVARTLKVPSRNVSVYADEIEVRDDAYYVTHSFDTTKRMVNFIEKFDENKTKVKPTIFSIQGVQFR
jgi:hypothetical protein